MLTSSSARHGPKANSPDDDIPPHQAGASRWLNLWRRIAADNEPAADRFIDLLTHHFRLLGDAPHAGRRRDELRRGYRSFPVGEYLILYRIMEPGVCIMHVLHGRRNLESLFRR